MGAYMMLPDMLWVFSCDQKRFSAAGCCSIGGKFHEISGINIIIRIITADNEIF